MTLGQYLHEVTCLWGKQSPRSAWTSWRRVRINKHSLAGKSQNLPTPSLTHQNGKVFEERVQFSAFLMGSSQRAKGDVPELFQPPTLLKAACQSLAPSWGTWRFLGLGPNHGETNTGTSQCPREGICCPCRALLAPTQLLVGS